MRTQIVGHAALGVVFLWQSLSLAQPAEGFPPQPQPAPPAQGYPPQPGPPAQGYPPQPGPPAQGYPSQPVPSPQGYPSQPAPSPQGYPPPPGGAPGPGGYYSPPPPAGAAPQYSPPPAQPQPGHGYSPAPPQGPYGAPSEPAQRASIPVPAPGPYFGAWLGVGGPFGGTLTRSDEAPQLSQGFGFLGAAGYAFISNFGANLFVHYNATEELVPSVVEKELDDNSGSVLLYGLELRGIIGSGPLAAWASLGLALGSGSLDLAASSSDEFSSSRSTLTYELDWKVMPVLAFGAEVEVVTGLSVGPQVRWYVTSADEACERVRLTSSEFGNDFSSKDCTDDFGDVTIPDILFLGLGATYRVDLGG